MTRSAVKRRGPSATRPLSKTTTTHLDEVVERALVECLGERVAVVRRLARVEVLHTHPYADTSIPRATRVTVQTQRHTASDVTRVIRLIPAGDTPTRAGRALGTKPQCAARAPHACIVTDARAPPLASMCVVSERSSSDSSTCRAAQRTHGYTVAAHTQIDAGRWLRGCRRAPGRPPTSTRARARGGAMPAAAPRSGGARRRSRWRRRSSRRRRRR